VPNEEEEDDDDDDDDDDVTRNLFLWISHKTFPFIILTDRFLQHRRRSFTAK
jgi:hypothetical protein